MKARPWTAEELQVVVVNYSLGVGHCMSLLPGRTKWAIRTRAQILGAAPPTRQWSEAEDQVITRLYPDYSAMAKFLPHRTRKATIGRARALGIQRKLRKWTGAAVRRLVNQAGQMSMKEIYRANPDRCQDDIRRYLAIAGVTPPKPRTETGVALLDQLRDRCLAYSIPFRSLGRQVGTTDGLKLSRHKGFKSLEAQWTEPAVHALGGELYVDWDD